VFNTCPLLSRVSAQKTVQSRSKKERGSKSEGTGQADKSVQDWQRLKVVPGLEVRSAGTDVTQKIFFLKGGDSSTSKKSTEAFRSNRGFVVVVVESGKVCRGDRKDTLYQFPGTIRPISES